MISSTFIPAYILSLFCFVYTVSAELVTRVVEYRQGGTVLEGYLVYDKAVKTARPGILVIHDWMGVSDFVKRQADSLAGLGYVAFAADIYGKGVRPTDANQARIESGKYKDSIPLLRARARAGLDYLAKVSVVDSLKLAVIGYCFGGTTALELARSGAKLRGTVSLHGNLNTPDPKDARNIQGSILVLHGADDPFVPEKQVENFILEMRESKADWQMVFYGNSVHSFTKPAAGDDNSKGSAFNAKAAGRSWKAMNTFFQEIF